MTKAPFTIRARLRGIRYAVSGLGFMLRTQHNAWLHLAATIGVCAAGLALGISAHDWLWVIIAIVTVWVAEAMNTAFEHLCDVVSPQFHESVQRSKDIAAGAVLICAAGAVVIGAIVFLPYVGRL
jgi:diacylglycerol kinase (ATP)